jgi:maltose O-acetyltransferase
MLEELLSIYRYSRFKRYLSNLKKRGLKIGNDTHIMDGVFLDPSHCFLISIGDNCTLAPNVRIMAHDASMNKFIGVTRIGLVRIHNNCFIGDSTLILPNVSIGPNTVIGAGSVVIRDIPADSIAAGNPARVIGSIEDFKKKHDENINQFRCFSEEDFNIDVISEKRKQEMIDYLNEHIAYMKRFSK